MAVCRKYEAALDNLAEMNDSARTSACGVARRVASGASGTNNARIKILREIHKHLKCKDRVRIEAWADEHTLGGLLELS